MSDRMTNVEIEDVLTSIRRLVMEGGAGPSPVVDRTAAIPTEGDRIETPVVTHGKFVLTPAFRVADPVQLRPVVTPLWPADAGLPLDILPDVDLSDAVSIAASDFTDVEPDVVANASDAPAPNAPAPDRRLRLADTVAGLEAAVTAQTDEWEPDGSEDVPVMDWSQTVPEDAPMFRSRHTGLLRSAPTVVNDVPTEVPAFRHNPRPDAAMESDDPDGVARFEAIAEEPMDDDLAAFIGSGSVMDEATLRALVIEIVRQELQGTLGERITRNVRKLVRREIAQAMTSAQYD